MYREIRREQIINLLRKQGQSSVSYLADRFQVTRETIRTDLTYLQNAGLIARHHGGASLKKHFMQTELIQNGDLNIRHLMSAREQIHSTTYQPEQSDSYAGKVCIFGSFNVDIVAKVQRFPKDGETLIARETTLGPGGKGANQALAALNAGATVHFATKVGRDQFNQFARHHFESSGIHSLSLYESASAPTGSAVIYVNDEGENIIAICPGANQQITGEEVAELMPYVSESDVLLVQLENNADALEGVLQLARGLKVTVILNPAPYSPDVERFLAYSDFITPNETEASSLSGIDIHDIETAKQAATIIHQKGAQSVIITMGSQGVVLFDGEKYAHIPAYAAVVVDTTGAGDAFSGALAASIARGENLIQAAHYATAFASLAVEQAGAANMPTRSQVEARMIQQQISVNTI
ncbi:ribokinase [Vibrio mangrovi]|uniref:Ribokinase n=1 Tax=Vibrio mangrovi TaxID=474394 RepID=A0A1Y6IXY8_9VIBR|nr:ribokinase [Vibrio mangrovi]MDW6003110.1 ribokinase [Vibrio mangrovi]SMS01352.1 Ribokinase [Vibrio mangrovi]